ncbi:MAG: nucleotidyltransferase [Bacilli bacterium]|nr:nucleotidyltransferase [Bacilli bacterium]
MKDITLVILAAGMGSRFGGLKQIERVGPNCEFIIDYSIYDAIQVGFNKVIFIIKEENYKIFKETIGKRVEKKIKVEYVFQNNDNIPKYYEKLKNRSKPLGTAHAILCCKNIIKEPFMVINADDYYGKDAFEKGYNFLKNKLKKDNYGLISYKVENTLSENGKVKRGICITEKSYLKKLIESEVKKKNNIIEARPLDSEIKPFIIGENGEASMNMFVFDSNILNYFEEKLEKHIKRRINELDKFEYYITDVLFELIRENKVKCEVIKTTSKWHGITYKEDLPDVRKAILNLIEKKEYPVNLWK